MSISPGNTKCGLFNTRHHQCISMLNIITWKYNRIFSDSEHFWNFKRVLNVHMANILSYFKWCFTTFTHKRNHLCKEHEEGKLNTYTIKKKSIFFSHIFVVVMVMRVYFEFQIVHTYLWRNFNISAKILRFHPICFKKFNIKKILKILLVIIIKTKKTQINFKFDGMR